MSAKQFNQLKWALSAVSAVLATAMVMVLERLY